MAYYSLNMFIYYYSYLILFYSWLYYCTAKMSFWWNMRTCLKILNSVLFPASSSYDAILSYFIGQPHGMTLEEIFLNDDRLQKRYKAYCSTLLLWYPKWAMIASLWIVSLPRTEIDLIFNAFQFSNFVAGLVVLKRQLLHCHATYITTPDMIQCYGMNRILLPIPTNAITKWGALFHIQNHMQNLTLEQILKSGCLLRAIAVKDCVTGLYSHTKREDNSLWFSWGRITANEILLLLHVWYEFYLSDTKPWNTI